MAKSTDDPVGSEHSALLEAVRTASTVEERREAVRDLARYNRDRNRETYDQLERE
jgi:hypothetical protein